MKKRYWVILFAIVIVAVMALALTNVIDETLGMCVSLALVIIFTFLVALGAYKSDVKIIVGVMVVFMILGVLLLGFNIYSLVEKSNNDEEKFYISVEQKESEKKNIFSYNERKYYTYNLENVRVNFISQEKSYPLEEAITKGYITLDKILSMAIPNDPKDDYQIYYDGGVDNYDNDEYSIILCSKSRDVIFAPYNFNNTKNICND